MSALRELDAECKPTTAAALPLAVSPTEAPIDADANARRRKKIFFTRDLAANDEGAST